VIELADTAGLAPATGYTIVVRGVRNVVGLSTDVSATVTTPAAPATPVAIVSSRRAKRYIARLRAEMAREAWNLELFADYVG
jgi:hypothetical protein